MIIIDYYNFLYSRYYDITEKILLSNIGLLEAFSVQNQIVIFLIFDGLYWKEVLGQEKKTLKYIYSHNLTADEIILNRFSHLQGKSHILVTNDNKLKNEMKKNSTAHHLSTSLFWKRLDLFFGEVKNNKIKKSNLIKTTDMENAFLDELYKNYFNK
jgi:hypothetical protein